MYIFLITTNINIYKPLLIYCDRSAGDAGEGGGPGLLRHQQEHRRPHTDVPAGLYHQARTHAAAMRSKLKHGHHDEGANIQQS